ncbi:MAG: ATP synthase F1 subunit delta [Prolixibacteraceae bacterium]|nr:ATP synthase F1 subunit delta [Prolixibacteraceae bacterium]
MDKITVRYAKAFFSLAEEEKMLDTLKTDIEQINQLCNKNEKFNLLLDTPVIGTTKKTYIINQIFNGKIDKRTLAFIYLIFKNKRENYLPSITKEIISLYQGNQHVKTAVITYAVPFDEKMDNQIKDLLEKELKSGIDLKKKVKPDIIGGFILRIDDKEIDASVVKYLRDIKEELSKTEIK